MLFFIFSWYKANNEDFFLILNKRNRTRPDKKIIHVTLMCQEKKKRWNSDLYRDNMDEEISLEFDEVAKYDNQVDKKGE